VTEAPALACGAAVLGSLWAKQRGAQALAGAAKLLAAAAFLWAASAWGLLESRPGRFAFAGLALSALGDALLIPAGAGAPFLAGMAAFAFAHAAYAAACLALGVDADALAIGAAIALPVFVFTWRWLAPRVPAALRAPVGAYTALVIAMALLACAATAGGAHGLLAAGGIAFALSDLSVARERFVAPGFANVAWGLPLYFAAQLAIAASLAAR
jgi:uncharacterized membrane protein YhhN